MIIREAVSSDISMMQAFIFDHGANSWNYLPEAAVKAHLSEISSQKVRAYLAEVDGECVGFASFHLGLPPTCQKYEENPVMVAYLSEIVVHRDHARQGIGSKLITSLREYLMANKITRLYAERHADNINSAVLMKKTGFKIIDEFLDEPRRSSGSKKTVVTMLEWV